MERIGKLHGIQTRISGEIKEIRFDSDHEIILYRIINEIFTNIIKHAKARRINVKTSIDEKIDRLNTELLPFKNNSSEIRILLEKLQKIITDFRNITKI